MRFTLTYNGRLPSSSSAPVKHGIRCKLHPQLKELWRTHPALTNKAKWIEKQNSDEKSDDEKGGFLAEIGSQVYASLVHPTHKLYAELDILVLRPEPPGALITHSGDIDNQLKTLFDALRQPASSNEVPKSWSPSPDEEPLHCLLADDKLITRVAVETDRLLIPATDPKDVQAIMRVSVKGFTATWGNLGMIG